MKLFLVFNIGCIECGVSSNVVGTFTSKQQADELAAFLNVEMGWREGGQNSFEVFELSPPGVITEEYLEAFGKAVESSPALIGHTKLIEG